MGYVLFGSFWQEMNMIKPGDNVVALHGQKEECPGVFLSSWMLWCACDGLQVSFTNVQVLVTLFFICIPISPTRSSPPTVLCQNLNLLWPRPRFLLYTLKKRLVYSMQTGVWLLSYCRRSGFAAVAAVALHPQHLGHWKVSPRCWVSDVAE